MDNFLSGALIAGIGVGAFEINECLNGRTNAKRSLKKLLKFSLTGGFVAAVAIGASNSIARREYLGATLKTALGVGGLLIADKLINLEN